MKFFIQQIILLQWIFKIDAILEPFQSQISHEGG